MQGLCRQEPVWQNPSLFVSIRRAEEASFRELKIDEKRSMTDKKESMRKETKNESL